LEEQAQVTAAAEQALFEAEQTLAELDPTVVPAGEDPQVDAFVDPVADPVLNLDTVEVAPENWIGIGGFWKQQLKKVTDKYPLYTHGLSLSIGSPDDLDVEFGIGGCEWWININEKDCYNVVHTHPGCDIIALYYPKISGNEDGTVTFVRTDGAQYMSMYENNSTHLNHHLVAEPGTIYLLPSHLLHFVNPNHSNDYRVSIAFNLSINK
jgi:hypothetical protein